MLPHRRARLHSEPRYHLVCPAQRADRPAVHPPLLPPGTCPRRPCNQCLIAAQTQRAVLVTRTAPVSANHTVSVHKAIPEIITLGRLCLYHMLAQLVPLGASTFPVPDLLTQTGSSRSSGLQRHAPKAAVIASGYCACVLCRAFAMCYTCAGAARASFNLNGRVYKAFARLALLSRQMRTACRDQTLPLHSSQHPLHVLGVSPPHNIS